MIDSSALLLTIVMTTPVETQVTPTGDYVSIHTLDGVMQRLCWPHSTTLNMQCDADASASVRHDEQEQNLMRALYQLRYIRHQR